MKKPFIISMISILAALGIGTSVAAFAINNSKEESLTKNEKTVSDNSTIINMKNEIHRNTQKFERRLRDLSEKYDESVSGKYRELLDSSDENDKYFASVRITSETLDLASDEIVREIIEIVKRSGYLPADYSFELNYDFSNEEKYSEYLIAVCKAYRDTGFSMTTDEKELLLEQIAMGYTNIVSYRALNGETADLTLKEIEKTLRNH